MPGFIFIKGNLKNDFSCYHNNKLIIENLEYNDIKIQRRTIKKFLNDKIFYQNKDYLIVTEGVIFNKFKLIKKYQKENFKDTIIEMYNKNGNIFFNEFRGSFSGILLDKIKKEIYIFTDQIGEKKIFYYRDKEECIISSDFFDLIKILKLNKKIYSLNKLAVYSFFTHGSIIENLTYLNEVKTLRGGEYIYIGEKKFESNRYHFLKTDDFFKKNENKIIEDLDNLFNRAISSQIEKNKEYSYENLAPLSAGYDSRMTNIVLKNFCKNVLNTTYSQNEYYDDFIPKLIANDLRNHWIFKSLNNGLSLFLFKKAINISYGSVLSYPICQLLDLYSNLNLEKVGVIHTGMFGECLAGDECNNTEPPYRSIRFKKKFKDLYSKFSKEMYDSLEIANYYNGSFIDTHMGSPKVFQEWTESFSPFYDVDFLEYTLKIPKKFRINHYIYDKWIIKKYPQLKKYKVNGKKIGDKYINILGHFIPLSNFYKIGLNYFLKKIKLKKSDIETQNHMNPLDYWYNNNNELKNFLDTTFSKHIIFLNGIEDIKKDCEELYYLGNTIEKDIALTFVLSYYNLFKRKEI